MEFGGGDMPSSIVTSTLQSRGILSRRSQVKLATSIPARSLALKQPVSAIQDILTVTLPCYLRVDKVHTE